MSVTGLYRQLLSERDRRWLALTALATRPPARILNLSLLLAVEAVRR